MDEAAWYRSFRLAGQRKVPLQHLPGDTVHRMLSSPPGVFSEQVVLANVLWLTRQDDFVDAVVNLPVKAFADNRHQVIAGAITALHSSGNPCDLATVTDYLDRTKTLDMAGGFSYVRSLDSTGLLVEAKSEHLDAINASYRRREARTCYLEAIGRIDSGEDPGQATDWLIERIEQLGSAAPNSSSMFDARITEALAEIKNRRDNPDSGCPTGWAELDAHLGGGWRPGQYAAVGARPGVGKSVVAVGWVRAAARAGHGTCVYSLEMPADEVTMRIIAAEGYVPYRPMQSGKPFNLDEDIDAEDTERMYSTAAAIRTWPLLIDDTGGLPMSEIRRRSAAFKRAREQEGAEHPLSLIIIDLLGLVGQEEGHRLDERGFLQELNKQCKNMAKQLRCAVISMAHLNRDAADAAHIPQLKDFKGSGGYEEYADIGIALTRSDAVDAGAERDDTHLRAHLLKFRQGENGKVFTRSWEGAYMTTADPNEGYNDVA